MSDHELLTILLGLSIGWLLGLDIIWTVERIKDWAARRKQK